MMKKLTMILACLFLSVGMAFAQSTVSGTVTSKSDGQPVIGATVKVVGINVGAVTDANGRFTFTAPKGAKHVEVSYVGMITQTIPVGSNLRIVLAEDPKVLDEVMVVAYGTTKKSSFTGSAETVDSKEMELRPITSATKAIEGHVNGVQTTSGSGQPGSSPSIIIRGFGSINASNTPLYVVDGIPYDGSIASINPSDIESMTVLKDASAGALYGARGAIGCDVTFAFEGAEIGAMEAKAAAKIMFADEKADVLDAKAKEYAALQNSCLSAAKRGYVDYIINPQDARKYVIGAFEMLYSKREDRPAKKHGII